VSWSERPLSAGRYVLSWDRRDDRGGRAGAGVYLARVRTQGITWIRRFVIL
jgi:hypothetical protein